MVRSFYCLFFTSQQRSTNPAVELLLLVLLLVVVIVVVVVTVVVGGEGGLPRSLLSITLHGRRRGAYFCSLASGNSHFEPARS